MRKKINGVADVGRKLTKNREICKPEYLREYFIVGLFLYCVLAASGIVTNSFELHNPRENIRYLRRLVISSNVRHNCISLK